MPNARELFGLPERHELTGVVDNSYVCLTCGWQGWPEERIDGRCPREKMDTNDNVLPEKWATDIYNVLVEECAATKTGMYDFVFHATHDGITEYRFIGALGMGGKFWYQPHNVEYFNVTCYKEDETPERLAMIRAAKARLLLIGYERAMNLATAKDVLKDSLLADYRKALTNILPLAKAWVEMGESELTSPETDEGLIEDQQFVKAAEELVDS